MAAWIDNRDYERRQRTNWLVPVITLALLFLLGIILLRPSQTANQDNFGGQAGVGGGPPTGGLEVTSTPTVTVSLTPTATPKPTLNITTTPGY